MECLRYGSHYNKEGFDIVGTGGNFSSVLIVEMGSEWYNIKAYYI